MLAGPIQICCLILFASEFLVSVYSQDSTGKPKSKSLFSCLMLAFLETANVSEYSGLGLIFFSVS